MTTWFDMSSDSAAASWREVRNHRAAPSAELGVNLRGHRADVFHMALEQSQQQFNAASVIGYESRPLNLFYGLSQAGRAIAAASRRLGTNEWLPTSHGLDFSTTLSAASGLMAQPLRVAPTSTDSFSRLVLALNGPSDLRTVTFGEVFASIPEVYLEFHRLDLGPVPLLPNGLSGIDLTFFPTRWEIDPTGLDPQDDRTVESVDAWRSQYPTLRPLALELNDAGTPQASNNPGWLNFTLESAEQLVTLDGGYRFPIGTTRYRGSEVILPKLGDSDGSLPPLARWWLLLFALSMLARYSPRDWASVMDIRHSPIASQVEFLLDTALDAVPNLVAESLRSLNAAD